VKHWKTHRIRWRWIVCYFVIAATEIVKLSQCFMWSTPHFFLAYLCLQAYHSSIF